MLKTFEAILLACMSLLLFSLCGCSDSGAKQEELSDQKVTVIESVEKISANFDKAQSLHMASVMGGNLAQAPRREQPPGRFCMAYEIFVNN